MVSPSPSRGIFMNACNGVVDLYTRSAVDTIAAATAREQHGSPAQQQRCHMHPLVSLLMGVCPQLQISVPDIFVKQCALLPLADDGGAVATSCAYGARAQFPDVLYIKLNKHACGPARITSHSVWPTMWGWVHQRRWCLLASCVAACCVRASAA